MDKGKAATDITASFNKLDLNRLSSSPAPKCTIFTPLLHSSGLAHQKAMPPSLVSLCLGVVGKHLEGIIGDLSEIAVGFPAPIKMAIVAIASQCKQVTAAGVSELVQGCKSLQTLRCGGCPRSDFTAHSCLGILKPELNDVEGDSWEELDTAEIAQGAESSCWFVWPRIDKDSLETLATECPRIIVNPKPSPFGFRGLEVPREALPDAALDDLTVKDKSKNMGTLRPQAESHSSISLKLPRLVYCGKI